MSILVITYLVAAVLVALYGANSLVLAVLYLWHRGKRQGPVAPLPGQTHPPEAWAADLQENSLLGTFGSAPEGQWPVVTVQLPIYNELYVVKRLIDAVARLEYPPQALQIQVLDDSTDETTRLARARVAHHRGRGVDIELIHREERKGYKAGALAAGLPSARGELIAIFDADFVPPVDFLKRLVPSLLADPELGFVQARWGYVNADYSLLTRAQSIALDGHFVVEHLGRNQSGLLVNFNGTAGVWRRQAIETAGGWQDDTLTEDLDLSFRAQLAGWKALYLPDLEAPAELPPQMAAFKRQQARWATGAAQCLVKLAGPMLRGRLVGEPGSGQPPARRLSLPAQLEGLLHLGVWVAHPMTLVLLLLTLPMLLGRVPLGRHLSVLWPVALGPTLVYALSQRHLYPDWKRRMLYVPGLVLLGTGLALSNTISIARGLAGQPLPFRRTPKFRIERRSDLWAGRRYVLPFEWLSVGELALALYTVATIAAAVALGNYFVVPFLLTYVGGFGYVGLHGLWEAWIGRRLRTRPQHRPAVADSQAK